MNKFLLRRLCTAMLALTFLVGLSMQGTAMTASGAVGGGLPMSDGCDACDDHPATGAHCPLVFCAGLSADIPETDGLAKFGSDIPSAWRRETGEGLSSSPDPNPPKSTDHS